jgi:hypothetical protein
MGKLWAVYRDYVHQVSVAVALFLILFTGLIVDVQLWRGHDLPSGYDFWIGFLGALAGINMAGTGVIRATGVPYLAAKALAQNGGPPRVSIAGDANVQTTAANIKPSNPAVVAGIQAIADAQRETIDPTDKGII